MESWALPGVGGARGGPAQAGLTVEAEADASGQPAVQSDVDAGRHVVLGAAVRHAAAAAERQHRPHLGAHLFAKNIEGQINRGSTSGQPHGETS